MRRLEDEIQEVEPKNLGQYAPVWQISPQPPPDGTSRTFNSNLFEKPVFEQAVAFISYTRKAVFLEVCVQSKWFGPGMPGKGENLQTVVVQPVFGGFEEDSEIVGHLVTVIPWGSFFADILHSDDEGLTVVLDNICNEVFTYNIQGRQASLVGEEDLHDTRYSSMEKKAIFADFANPQDLVEQDICVYTLHTYPTKTMEDAYRSTDPVISTASVVCIIGFISLVFLLYDFLVQRRQISTMKAVAQKNDQLFPSLFPDSIRKKLQQTKEEGKIMEEGAEDAAIASLYLNCTVFNADIAGFTA